MNAIKAVDDIIRPKSPSTKLTNQYSDLNSTESQSQEKRTTHIKMAGSSSGTGGTSSNEIPPPTASFQETTAKPSIAPKPQVPPPPPPKPSIPVSESARPTTLPIQSISSTNNDGSGADNANNNVLDTTAHDESPEKLSLKARLKLFEKEIEQQGSTAPVPRTDKKFSFLNADELAQDKTLEDVEEMDDMRMGIRSQASRKTSAPASLSSGSHMLHTAKGERRLREKVEREGIDNLPEEEQAAIAEAMDENLSPAEKRSMEAERRAAWRKARLKSLENDAIQAQMVIQKMSELVTSDSPIDDLDDESSEGQQGPLSSISENPASPMTSLGNEAEEEERENSEALDADTKN